MNIKNLIPKRLRMFLKKKYRIISNQNNIHKNLKKSRNNLKSGKKIKVLFIAQFPEMWNSDKPVFELMNADDRFETRIFAVPKADYNKTYLENEMLDYLTENGIHAENAFQNGRFIDVGSETDFVFLQRPYDSWMPNEYMCKNIEKKALICYIPYSGRITCEKHISIEFNEAFLSSFYSVFADCDEAYNYVTNWIKLNHYSNNKKVYRVGFPRFDLVDKSTNDNRQCKVFLWTPRWYYGDSQNNDNGHFLDYYSYMLDYFKSHPDLKLIIRPHPLMFSYLLKVGAVTEEEVERINSIVNELVNVCFDNDKDYIASFKESDCLIADPTSLLIEYFPSGKPIIFCERVDFACYTKQATAMMKSLYYATCTQELFSRIEYLVLGKDESKSDREKIIKDLLISDGNSSHRIVEALIQGVLDNS